MKHNGEETSTFLQLTKRELDVLQLLVKGLDNREIAQCLVLSEQTVRNYVCQIYSKLEAKNRVQAALRAIYLELVHMPNENDGKK